MRYLNASKRATISIYKTQKILQIKDIYSLEPGRFMYKYNKSQLPATFNDYFKLITDVHPYTTRQTRTRKLVLLEARSNSGTKNAEIQCSSNMVTNSFRMKQ